MSSFINQYLESFGGDLSLFGIIWYIVVVIGLWKMFTKAHEAGWKALIPFYNTYILYKIAWKGSMFWITLLVEAAGIILTFMGGIFFYIGLALSIVGAIMIAVLFYNISISYGHGFPYFLGLYFLQPIFVCIIGYGSSRYLGNRYQNA